MTTAIHTNGTQDTDNGRLELEAQLALRDAMLQAVSYAAQRFLSGEPLEQTLPRVLERLGVAANVGSVYYFGSRRTAPGEYEIALRHEWAAPGIAPSHSNLRAPFRSADAGLGRWDEVLSRGEVICGHTRNLPDGERQPIEITGARSVAVVPVIAGGEWLGYLGFSVYDGEREWSAGEVSALKAAAAIMAAALERRRMDEELQRHSAQDEIIIAQQAALQELSTPLMAISDSAMVMPLVGAIDSSRAQQIIETLLEGVSAQRARVAIIDITGVSVVDTQVANALLRAAQAVKLLGAHVVLTGIRPEIAQTLVGLGVDLGGLITRSTLQAGIAFAMQQQ